MIQDILDKIKNNIRLTSEENRQLKDYHASFINRLAKGEQLEDVEDTIFNNISQYFEKAQKKTNNPLIGRATTKYSGDIANKVGNAALQQKTSGTPYTNNTQNSILKSTAIGQYAVDGAKAINGLVQLIKGKKTLKNLKEPKAPKYLANQMLATRLAEANTQAQMADPIIRTQGLNDLAKKEFAMNKLGASINSGDISGYGAFAQANADNYNNGVRGMMVDQIQNKLQKQNMYDNLLNMSQQEREFEYANKLQQFNKIDYPEFQAKRQYGENQVNTGISNIYGAGESMVNNNPLLSYLKALRMKKDIFANRTPRISSDSTLPQFR